MNEQELIHELNHVENERAMWKATAIKCGFEMVELKAQVNCLREFIEYAPIELSHLTTASALLRKTPEQCLAEVKAKAWDEGYCFGVADERTSDLIRQQEQAHNDRMGRDEIRTKIEPARNNPYKS